MRQAEAFPGFTRHNFPCRFAAHAALTPAMASSTMGGRESRSNSITYADFGQYAGATGEGLRQGRGHYSFANPYFKYNGGWEQGVMHGEGTLTLADGSSYEGAFVAGEMSGFGLRRWPDGATYSGQFLQGEMHGAGTYIAADGEQYEGSYEANRRHGQGMLTLANGDRYEGDFVSQQRTGEGAMAYASGDAYRGAWHTNRRSGQGTLQLREGGLYRGNFDEDSPHGEGQYTQPSGYAYVGAWASGVATHLANRALPTMWVSPAATLLLSGLRAAGLSPPPPPAEGAEDAELPAVALTVRAALLKAEEFLEAGAGGSAAESVPCAFTSGAEEEAMATTLAWAEEEVLTLQLPAGSPRPATLRLSLHDANGDEVCAAEVTLGEHYSSCDPGVRGYLEAISLAPPGAAAAAEEEGAPPPPSLDLQYEVQLPTPPPAEAEGAAVEAEGAAAAAAEAGAEAGTEAAEAEVGPEVDEGGEVGEELLEAPSLPRLEAKAGEMLPGIQLRLVRERTVETPPTEEELAADPEAVPSRRQFVHSVPAERGRLVRVRLKRLEGAAAEAAEAAAAEAAAEKEAAAKGGKGGKADPKKARRHIYYA